MQQTGSLEKGTRLTPHLLKDLLKAKIQPMDMQLVKRDVENSIKDPADLEIWSHDFFYSITEQILFSDQQL